MRKLIQKALLRHVQAQEEFTGALLMTFRGGRPALTGLVDGADEAAETIIMSILNGLEVQDDCRKGEGPIDHCLGRD
jgi:hypothetical protein